MQQTYVMLPQARHIEKIESWQLLHRIRRTEQTKPDETTSRSFS